MTPRRLVAVIAVLALIMVLPALVNAAAVGQFTMVEGQVDLLRQGKLPAAPAKVRDGVEPGDVVRTKSKSKAQLKFVDDSIVTLAPESRMAVADFVYDPARGYRRAVLRYFRGLMHTVVTQLIKVQEPEFIIETHTAVTGVRGTGGFFAHFPNRTILYCTQGIWQVQSKNPKFPELVLVNMGEYAEISGDQKIVLGTTTPAMLEMLRRMMDAGLRDGAMLGVVPRVGEGAAEFPDSKSLFRPDQPFIPPKVVPPVLTPPATPPPPPSGGPSGPSSPPM